MLGGDLGGGWLGEGLSWFRMWFERRGRVQGPAERWGCWMKIAGWASWKRGLQWEAVLMMAMVMRFRTHKKVPLYRFLPSSFPLYPTSSGGYC